MKRDLTEHFIKDFCSRPPWNYYKTNETQNESIYDTFLLQFSDMIDFNPSTKKGYRHNLIVSENFSKYGWTILLEKKVSQTKTDAS